jgi:hypothetical protein
MSVMLQSSDLLMILSYSKLLGWFGFSDYNMCSTACES